MVSTEVDPAEWDAYVEGHPESTGYHLWAWRALFQDVFGHQSAYIVARRHGRITGVLPLVCLRTWLFGRFAVSLPFVNYGGSLCDDAESGDELLAGAARIGNAWDISHLELRHRRRQHPDLPAKHHKVTMLLPLAPSVGAMWDALDRKVRNQIRKAEKAQLQTVVGGAELVESFYGVFAHNMRDLGIPVHSKRFFSNVLERFPDRARVVLVRQEQQPIAGAITYAYRDSVEVPWASSRKEYLPLCPNNLLYWRIIQEAIAAGAGTLDFGRSTPNEGTFHFKRQWGASPAPLHWEYQLLRANGVPDLTPKNPRFKIAIDTWKHLPLRMTELLGPQIVRGMPY
jgi:FemAB-related protein (PEP-CTERM system-associated)